MITEEVKNQNFILFQKKLEKLGIDIQPMIDGIGDKLLNAPCSTSIDSGLAYDGALIHNILKVITPYAVRINELLPDSIKVDKISLVKVCLLHQLSKALMFIPNDNTWEIEKRGMLYKYAESNLALKTGIRSLILCQEYGIKFTPEEVEAMTIIDREPTDEQARFFANPISVIVRQANELATLENKNLNKENNG
jgi:hypothetical protein